MRLRHAFAIAILIIAAGRSATGQTSAPLNQQRIVVLISLDGFPAYALKDPRLPIPTLRRLAREGAMTTAMRPVNPTVTWPNHTAMVTGVDAATHHVLYNGLLDHPGPDMPVKVEPWRDKSVLVHAPTIYDIAFQAGLKTAQVDWVAVTNAHTITWEFPERPRPDGPIEKELIENGLVTADQLAKFHESSPAWRDQIWTEAAAHILRKHKPNLLLFHLLNMDSIHHRYGPMSIASFNAFAFADDRVKQIVEALREADLIDRTTVLIVSDHGFEDVKHVIHPNVILAQNGLLHREGTQLRCEAYVLPEGGTAMVYVTDPAKRKALVPKLTAALRGLEGLEALYGEEDFPKLGLPTVDQSDQPPDLLLAAKPGYAFAGGDSGELVTQQNEGGSHGYLSTAPEMQALFLASGNGIRNGVSLEQVRTIDIAPTIAALLGLDMPKVQGKVVREILK